MSVLTFRGKGGEEDCLLTPITNPVRFFTYQVLHNLRFPLKLHFLRQASPNTLNRKPPLPCILYHNTMPANIKVLLTI